MKQGERAPAAVERRDAIDVARILALAGCAALVAATAWVRGRIRPRPGGSPAPLRRLALGAVVSAAGGAYIGLYGPADAGQALVCCGLLGAGWLLLRTNSSPEHAPTRR